MDGLTWQSTPGGTGRRRNILRAPVRTSELDGSVLRVELPVQASEGGWRAGEEAEEVEEEDQQRT